MSCNDKPENVMETVETVADSRHARLSRAQQMSKEEFSSVENCLKRKLDIRLTAMIVFIYILNFLDRNNIATSKIAGIEDDLRLTPTQFSTAVAILFVGYILMQVPSNIFLAQLRPSIYIPCCMAAWGVISTCTGAVQNAGGLYAARFMLGFVEACFYPGAIFLFSCWYKRSELGVRCAFLYSGSQVGSAFSGLIAAGITSGLDGARGMRAWRWIFIIEGAITVAVALLSFFILPDFPTTTRWLSPEERLVAEVRLSQDAAGDADEDGGAWAFGFKEAFKDYRTYIFAAIFHCVLVTTSTQNFFPTVVETLGFGRIGTLLLTVPPYVIGIVLTIVNNYYADRLCNSSYNVSWPLAVSIVGFVVGAATLNIGARYFAMVLMIGGGHGANAVAIAWVSKTMLRPRMKRAAAVAFVNACGNAAQIWTPYIYTGGAPRYVIAMSVNSAFAIVGIALSITMRLILVQANKKLAMAEDIFNGTPFQEKADYTGDDAIPQELLVERRGFKYVT